MNEAVIIVYKACHFIVFANTFGYPLCLTLLCVRFLMHQTDCVLEVTFNKVKRHLISHKKVNGKMYTLIFILYRR